MNRNFTTKLSNFLLGNGFYIALTLCVCFIGVAGYYLMSSVTLDSTPVSSSTPLEIPSNEVTMPTPSPSPAPVTPNPTLVPETDTKDTVANVEQEVKVEEVEVEEKSSALIEPVEKEETPTVEESQETAALRFVLPVEGSILQAHSLEVLSYNETFGDWRVHPGIDVATVDAAPVYAITEGYVSAIYSDNVMGTTVVVMHPNELESTYSNLSKELLVEIGDSVEMGQQIATVGGTSLYQQNLQTHLHLAVTASGSQVDPMVYLPNFIEFD